MPKRTTPQNEETIHACLTYLQEKDIAITQETLSRKTHLDYSQIRKAMKKLSRSKVLYKPGSKYRNIILNLEHPLTDEDKLFFSIPTGLTNISQGALAFYLAVLLYIEDHIKVVGEYESGKFLHIDSRDIGVILKMFGYSYESNGPDFGIQCEERGLIEINRNKDPSYSYRILKEFSYDEILDANDHPSLSKTLSDLLEDREQVSLNLPAPRKVSKASTTTSKKKVQAHGEEGEEDDETRNAINALATTSVTTDPINLKANENMETLLDKAVKAGYYEIYSDDEKGFSHSMRIKTLEYVKDYHAGEGMEVVGINEDGIVTLCPTS